jgi:iron(III) transport system ATP-binding protein
LAHALRTQATLEVRGLVQWYGKVKAVDDVSFELYPGEVLTLLGPSGCGKSTTLRLVAGLEEPAGGEVIVRGRLVASASKHVFVPAEKRNLGLVFQSYAVWPHMTVEQNVAYPLEIRNIPRQRIQQKVREVVAQVGLEDFLKRPATQLSGGQQQRVALARALAYEPDLLLLDEPLSNLDAKLREEMRVQLKALQNRLGTTILYVTHDQAEAMSLSHRVAVMHQGRIQQLGAPAEIYERPANYFVQSFVGRTLAFDGVVRRRDAIAYVQLDAATDMTLEGADLPAEGAQVRIAVRPEDVRLEPRASVQEPNTLCMVLEDVIYGGDHLECVLRAGAVQIVVNAPKDLHVQRGQQLALKLDPAKVKVWTG